MNNVNLVDRLAKAPELKQTASNTNVLIGTFAVNCTFKSQNGEREVDFINIVAWRQTAEIIAQYCGKGSRTRITGRIQTRNYEDQQGQRVYVTEVVTKHVGLLDGKGDDQQGQSNDYNQQPQQNSYMQQGNPLGNSNPMDILDDTLPL